MATMGCGHDSQFFRQGGRAWYDGDCGFCGRSIKAMGWVDGVEVYFMPPDAMTFEEQAAFECRRDEERAAERRERELRSRDIGRFW